jgi:hypothetical protein
MERSQRGRPLTDDERAEALASEPPAPGPVNETLDVSPTPAGMTRAQMEAAALAGRQVAGRLENRAALRLLREGE